MPVMVYIDSFKTIFYIKLRQVEKKLNSLRFPSPPPPLNPDQTVDFCICHSIFCTHIDFPILFSISVGGMKRKEEEHFSPPELIISGAGFFGIFTKLKVSCIQGNKLQTPFPSPPPPFPAPFPSLHPPPVSRVGNSLFCSALFRYFALVALLKRAIRSFKKNKRAIHSFW